VLPRELKGCVEDEKRREKREKVHETQKELHAISLHDPQAL
jgi:hypothetical protein